MVRQTARTRCLAPDQEKVARRWKELSNFGYKLYDEKAVDEYLRAPSSLFPQLPQLLKCLSWSTKYRIFSYKLLYEEGGIFVDWDLLPSGTLLETSSLPNEDGVMVYVGDKFSLGFLAVSPHHPLLYILLQRATGYVMQDQQDYLEDFNFFKTAFSDFIHHPGIRRGGLRIKAGKYVGVDQRSVKLVKQSWVEWTNVTLPNDDRQQNVSCLVKLLQNHVDGFKV
jgi:hypothetical protein